MLPSSSATKIEQRACFVNVFSSKYRVLTRRNEFKDRCQEITGAPEVNFRICSEDDLRSRIFGTFVVKFLACLPLLGFSNI